MVKEGFFWCDSHLEDRPLEEQSADPRYCKKCHDFLLTEPLGSWTPVDDPRKVKPSATSDKPAPKVKEPKKKSNLELVRNLICPHCQARLDPIKVKDERVRSKCSKCGHVWYGGKGLKGARCLTCQKATKNAEARNIRSDAAAVTSDEQACSLKHQSR